MEKLLLLLEKSSTACHIGAQVPLHAQIIHVCTTHKQEYKITQQLHKSYLIIMKFNEFFTKEIDCNLQFKYDILSLNIH